LKKIKSTYSAYFRETDVLFKRQQLLFHLSNCCFAGFIYFRTKQIFRIIVKILSVQKSITCKAAQHLGRIYLSLQILYNFFESTIFYIVNYFFAIIGPLLARCPRRSFRQQTILESSNEVMKYWSYNELSNLISF
jgi:hypothetical protein